MICPSLFLTLFNAMMPCLSITPSTVQSLSPSVSHFLSCFISPFPTKNFSCLVYISSLFNVITFSLSLSEMLRTLHCPLYLILSLSLSLSHPPRLFEFGGQEQPCRESCQVATKTGGQTIHPPLPREPFTQFIVLVVHVGKRAGMLGMKP